MSRSLIFSDLHLHNHKDRVDRLVNCLDVLEWVFETAKKENCKYIFFLGDLFHEREKIDVRNYMETFNTFMKHLNTKCCPYHVYLLVGNHDMYHKENWRVNSVQPLSAIPNCTIIDVPQQINFDGLKIDWMPYSHNPIRDLNELKRSNQGSGDILFGHMSVDGAMLNLMYGTRSDVIVEHENEMIKVDKNVFVDWKHVFLGHFHGAQLICENVEYVGSPLELSFGEAFQEKHIIVLDHATLERKYIVNDFSPKHLIITTKDIEEKKYDLNGNFVRVAVENMSPKEVLDIKKSIASNNEILSLAIKPIDKKENDKLNVENAKLILLNVDKMIDEYMAIKEVPTHLDRQKVREFFNKYITK